MLQYTLFPQGLAYDSQIEHYRTPVVNSVIGCIADLSKELGKQKAGLLQILKRSSAQYPEGESNPYVFRHTPLKRTRLPFRHPGIYYKCKGKTKSAMIY